MAKHVINLYNDRVQIRHGDGSTITVLKGVRINDHRSEIQSEATTSEVKDRIIAILTEVSALPVNQIVAALGDVHSKQVRYVLSLLKKEEKVVSYLGPDDGLMHWTLTVASADPVGEDD